MAVSSVTSLSTLTGGSSVITIYDKELRRKAVLRDIYTNLKADDVLYDGQRMSIPNGFWWTVRPQGVMDANNIRVTYKMPVNSNILRGATVALGTEVAPVLKTGSLYRNNYRIVFQAEPGYGIDKLDAAPYRLYQVHTGEDLSAHAAAELGLEIRMAIVETFGWNLMAGATATVCPAQWNRNFFVGGLRIDQQPVFHPNFNTYTQRIINAVNLASGNNGLFAQSAAQCLSGLILDQIGEYGLRRRMTPLSGELPYYVLTISGAQAARFSDPRYTDTLGNRWSAMNTLNEKVQNWYGILGRWRSAVGIDIYLVLDERLPTLEFTGTAAPFGMSVHYVWPTDNDDRQLDNRLIRDASLLHGKGGLVNLEQEKLHYITDDYDYKVRNGYGYAGVRGVQHLEFDNTPVDPTGAAREYAGSAVICLGRPDNF